MTYWERLAAEKLGNRNKKWKRFADQVIERAKAVQTIAAKSQLEKAILFARMPSMELQDVANAASSAIANEAASRFDPRTWDWSNEYRDAFAAERKWQRELFGPEFEWIE